MCADEENKSERDGPSGKSSSDDRDQSDQPERSQNKNSGTERHAFLLRNERSKCSHLSTRCICIYMCL